MGNLFSNPKAKKGFSIGALVLLGAVGVALAIGNSLAYGRYSTVLSQVLTKTGDAGSESAQAARNMGNELAREIEREGIVMLRNEDDCLPLSRDITKVNVFGHGSIDWYYMSSGSERVGMEGQTSYNLNEALEHYGIETNKEISNYYTKWHKAEGDANTIMASFDSFYQIREPWLQSDGQYQSIYENAKSFSDTALYVISRHAGENSDCPHYQNKIAQNGSGTTKDNDRSYLEISTEEEYAIQQIAQDFENVIIVINSTNTMRLDFIENIEGIDACISVGATGVQGALSIPEILWGDASPSGHLTDTIPYDLKYNVTYFRGNAKFTHQYTGGKSADCKTMGAGGNAFYQASCYVEYTEGIYVGYRWFETADAEGFWDKDPYNGYENVVQFPFGYGMSYTTFDWKLLETSKPVNSLIRDNLETITLTVQVENTGDVAGKDVIEVYLKAPYIPGEIEKSAVKLVAYAKTPELQPGQKANVEIEVETKEFKSYDCYDDNNNGHTGYEMDAGDYILELHTDAHNIKDMDDASIKYRLGETLNIDEDEKSGNTVENRFTGDTAYEEAPIDGSSVDQDIEFIHRNEFPELLTEVEPNKPWNDKLLNRADGRIASNSCYTKQGGGSTLDAWDEATEDYFGEPVPTELPTWGASGDAVLMEGGKLTDLGFTLAEDYNAPEWDEVLDQVPFNKAQHILTMDTQYKSPGIAAIGLRTDDDGAFQHAEGASQVGNGYMAPGTSCVGYPGSTVLAQTWNQTLAYMFGKSEGNDMIPAGKDALYSPACNIHRSPFGGRNSGYQSEDPYLSGRVVGNLIRGLGCSGKTSFVKHFALNDQDFNRMGLYTWCTEQALREIYIRSFEEAIKYGDSTGVMTSFNRIGNIWAGGNEALIQGILRYEWGFNGCIITDMTENETNMDGGAGLRAGGNINLGGYSTKGKALNQSAAPRLQWRAREAIKQFVYAYIHAAWKNETYNASADPSDAIIVYETKLPYIWWKPAIAALDGVVYSAILVGAYFVLKNGFGLFNGQRKED
ncbi:MAG: glycoside hydrolase family 3 C-terminal domain-containing protein [Bacilli bacterium]|nr:glycoside hydrolase family 3 C-terminal domain-containing protein [Bacilli bacterium]